MPRVPQVPRDQLAVAKVNWTAQRWSVEERGEEGAVGGDGRWMLFHVEAAGLVRT